MQSPQWHEAQCSLSPIQEAQGRAGVCMMMKMALMNMMMAAGKSGDGQRESVLGNGIWSGGADCCCGDSHLMCDLVCLGEELARMWPPEPQTQKWLV